MSRNSFNPQSDEGHTIEERAAELRAMLVQLNAGRVYTYEWLRLDRTPSHLTWEIEDAAREIVWDEFYAEWDRRYLARLAAGHGDHRSEDDLSDSSSGSSTEEEQRPARRRRLE